MIHKISST